MLQRPSSLFMRSVQTRSARCAATWSFVALASLIASPSALASASYTGGVYTENFNSLPTDPPNNASLQGTTTGKYANGWADDSTTIAATQISLPGWYLYYPTETTTEGGTNNHQRFREGNGQNTGSFWGFGSSSSDSEKALGDVGSTTTAPNGENFYIGFRLTNNTANTITEFKVTYDGEQWRDGQATTGETLSFAYSTTATTADWNTTATFVSVNSLDFTAPVPAGTSSSGTGVDGNTAGKVADISATISGVSIAPGQEVWLRWADAQLESNADDGLAIDNLRFQATPEPTGAGLLLLGGFGVLTQRRRRKRH
jgi:hypothetical protein